MGITLYNKATGEETGTIVVDMDIIREELHLAAIRDEERRRKEEAERLKTIFKPAKKKTIKKATTATDRYEALRAMTIPMNEDDAFEAQCQLFVEKLVNRTKVGIYQLNNRLTITNGWGPFTEIRSVNDYSTRRNEPGIIRNAYKRVCVIIGMSRDGGATDATLIRSSSY